jgi:hypothetical protein
MTNSAPVDVGLKRGANDKDLSAKIKKAKDLKDLSEKMAGMLNKRQIAATSRRQEPWCRLISQYASVRLFTRSFNLYNHDILLFQMRHYLPTIV